jgi:opacity protein-like surface antigen
MKIFKRTYAPPSPLLLMLAFGSSAADLNSWNGFYGGASVGASLGRMDFSSETSRSVSKSLFDHDAHGALVGLQVGANWQFRKHMVIGFEADHSIASWRGRFVMLHSGYPAGHIEQVPPTAAAHQRLRS